MERSDQTGVGEGTKLMNEPNYLSSTSNPCDVTASGDVTDFGVWSSSYAKPKLMFWFEKGF
jgi:hypothetical protein